MSEDLSVVRGDSEFLRFMADAFADSGGQEEAEPTDRMLPQRRAQGASPAFTLDKGDPESDSAEGCEEDAARPNWESKSNDWESRSPSHDSSDAVLPDEIDTDELLSDASSGPAEDPELAHPAASLALESRYFEELEHAKWTRSLRFYGVLIALAIGEAGTIVTNETQNRNWREYR